MRVKRILVKIDRFFGYQPPVQDKQKLNDTYELLKMMIAKVETRADYDYVGDQIEELMIKRFAGPFPKRSWLYGKMLFSRLNTRYERVRPPATCLN